MRAILAVIALLIKRPRKTNGRANTYRPVDNTIRSQTASLIYDLAPENDTTVKRLRPNYRFFTIAARFDVKQMTAKIEKKNWNFSRIFTSICTRISAAKKSNYNVSIRVKQKQNSRQFQTTGRTPERIKTIVPRP